MSTYQVVEVEHTCSFRGAVHRVVGKIKDSSVIYWQLWGGALTVDLRFCPFCGERLAEHV